MIKQSYWLAIYVTILIEEHFIFRKGNVSRPLAILFVLRRISDHPLIQFDNYALDQWNDPSKMPVGYAVAATVVVGAVGAILGMAQVM